MTDLYTCCPYCDVLGEIHCAQAGCDWMVCESCTQATVALFGFHLAVTWRVHSGRAVTLPQPRARAR